MTSPSSPTISFDLPTSSQVQLAVEPSVGRSDGTVGPPLPPPLASAASAEAADDDAAAAKEALGTAPVREPNLLERLGSSIKNLLGAEPTPMVQVRSRAIPPDLP